MMTMSETSAVASDWVEVGNGGRRRILSHTPDMMVVEVDFAPGGCGPEHSHLHLQATYVRSGRFEFVIDGKTQIVGPGDALLVPSAAPHSCKVLDAGTLIDVFTPAREDFLAS